MVIEQAIEQQRRLVAKWEARAKDLKETISKHPWDKMGYDFGDWRESELLRRNKQIAESKLIIEVLKISTSLIRDSEPFEADKVFIHCDKLRGIAKQT